MDEIRRRMQYAKSNGEQKEYEDLEFQERRKNNVLEYGQDITSYIQRLSLNKNVLQQKTYVVVSYYAAEFDSKTYSKSEIENLCFSELYTRCQTIISSLAACEVTGRVLDSEELAELLYVAYNRDDAELIQVSKALDSGYDALYTTSKDVMEKRQELIEEQVMQDAVNLVTDSIISAEANVKRRKEKKEQVKEAALEIMEEYKDQVDEELYDEIKSEIEINAEDLEAEYEEEEEIQEMSRKPIATRKK